MNKSRYDYIIIGAGPAGLFFAYKLALKEKNKSILLVDKGQEYRNRICPILHGKNICNCTKCSIISGIGGSAFYIPAKLSNYPAGSKLIDFFSSENDCRNTYLDVLNIFKKLGLNALNKTDIALDDKYQAIINSAQDLNIFLKYYFSQEFTKDNFSEFMAEMLWELDNLGVEIKANTEITNIKKNEQIFCLIDNMGGFYECNKLIIATGESGAFWLHKITKQFDINKKISSIDIGIRIEFAKEIIDNLYSYHKDPKFIFAAPDGSELRTYCTLSNARVVICKNDDFRVVDGISCNYDNGKGAMTLFNRIIPSSEIIEYAKEISDNVKTICNSKIAYSTMGELLSNNVCKTNIIPSLNYTKAVKLNEIIPYSILNNLKYGIIELSKIIKGLDDPQNIIYYPAIDKLWNELILKPNFETSVSNLYVIGDSSGIARGIFQSALMGYICAQRI